MAARIQIRRDYSSNWTLNNPILTEGELGYELDSGKLKVGDGVKNWNSLSYFQETVNYTDVVDPPRNLSYFTDDVGFLRNTSPAGGISNANISNWNTAYGWGNHAVAGYLTISSASSTYLTISNAASTYQPVDADLTAIAALSGTSGFLKKTAANTWVLDTTQYLTSGDTAAGITSQQIANWNTAYNWGNHASAGYLTQLDAATQYQPYDADLVAIAASSGTGFLKRTGANTWTLDTNTYLTTETDPVFSASAAANVTSTLINRWNTAYSWGDHSVAGYLTTSDAASTYLTTASAASTYLTTASAASTYLTTASASSTYLTISSASSNYQPLDADLTSIAGLSGTSGFLKKTAANTWSLDTNTYLTGNQSITISGDASGSGTTSISLTLANSGVTIGTYRSVTVDAKGRVTSGSNPTTLSGYGITDAQPLDADLTAIAGLSGTSGLLRKTAADTWSLDTKTYAELVSAPATATSTGTAGQIAYDSSYVYICTATNTWKRAAIASW